MLISRVSEDSEGRPPAAPLDHSHEYQTASELFDLMAKNHPFESDVGETLSARDLVILYKNIDLGTKLMSNAEEFKRKKPNQHVETIVYNDELDSEGSDVSEIYGTDDLQNVYSINNERLDLFNSRPSLENTLCPKLGDLEIQASNLSMNYDQHFLFKDPYIKEQLKHLNRLDGGECDGFALPASLLDYICCKRLEDNYNFYMDNIIRYVKHTIEQLKRISNGDYLTDRAKEKWREVENTSKDDDENTKVLATSTSIPVQVERKVNGHSTMWDDIIHSEVDVRSLSKILEKKIIVEVPKLICGSYKLFSKLCSDNLIISCKREEAPVVTEKKEPRVDVVLQLERSESGQVMSNISSMIIVQATPPIQLDDCPKSLPWPFIEDDEKLPLIEDEKEVELPNAENEEETVKHKIKKVKIVEIQETNDDSDENEVEDNNDLSVEKNGDDMLANTDIVDADYYNVSKSNSVTESGDSSVALRDILDTRAIPDILRKEAPYNFISPDDLSLSMHKLNMSSLPEESVEDISHNAVQKKRSNTKIRIKSPYENKSYIMEEKKRKKLLEIREKREKRKMAVGENCKVTKHRYGKGIMPSSSVTNLSITNKSFYNSIYGQNVSFDTKSTKSRGGRRGKRELLIEPPLEQLKGEHESPMLTPEKNNIKYINRSYYLDEAVTEMMYTELRQSDCSSVRELFSGTASAASAEFSGKRNKLDPSEPDLNEQLADCPHDNKFDSHNEKKDSFNDNSCNDKSFNLLSRRTESRTQMIISSRSINNVVPANSPKDDNIKEEGQSPKKTVPTVECRKSIEKLYNLMKKLGNAEPLEIRSSKSKLVTNITKMDAKVGQGSSTIIQGSDSGTSLKHHLTSSNPSSFSFEKINNSEEIPAIKIMSNKKTDALTTVVPKVIISTKQQTVKVEVDKTKKERKRVVINPLPKVPDNPLKAISQLLHEFDSVQKTRHRPPSDSKLSRKPDTPLEARSVPRPGIMVKRRSRIDQPLRENEVQIDKNVKVVVPRDRRPRPNPTMEPLKIPHQQIPIEEKHFDRVAKEERHNDRAARDKHLERVTDRFTKKKIADIIDEVKEAKGEAVRGPSKMNSRLNTLAQPKKSYVQAHSEEYQTKYGKNLMADRLQRLASAPPAPAPERQSLAARNRPKRSTEAMSSVSVRPPPSPQPLERGLRLRRSASSSPDPRAAPARHTRATDAPDPIFSRATDRSKMVAVESYVKSHYGCASPAALGELLGAHTARVPLVPNDLDLASEPSSPTADESTAIGSKLHRIIDSMINAKPAPLAALVESRETVSRPSDERDDLSLVETHFSPGPSSVDSDYRADIFEDKNVKTAVESFQDKPDDPNPDEASEKSATKYEQGSELQKLEDAFDISMGAFPKRRRIKDLSLAPKQSMQQVLVVQSGDAGSIVLKSTISKSLKLNTSRSDVTADLNTLPTFQKKPQLDWNFRSNIPMQIATVGYAFPEYHAAYSKPNSAIKSLDNIFKLGISVSSISKGNKKSDKTSQCFKGSQSKHDGQDNSVSSQFNQDAVSVSRKKPTCIASVATDAATFINIENTCGNCINMLKDTCQVEAEELKVQSNIENVDCTSSLDMLVGLLNEIQKITTCHITDTVHFADKRECDKSLDVNAKAALKDTVTNIHSHELVSIASLDKLRQLESSPSIYSLYLSDGDKETTEEKIGIPRLTTSLNNTLCDKIPSHVDKEVGADFPVREYANTFTDVPSTFFPITITHSTNVTNSLIGILSKPSSQSIISLNDYESTYSDTNFNCTKKVIRITEKSEISHKICEMSVINNPESEKQLGTCGKVVNETKIIAEVHKVKSEINLFDHQSKCYTKSPDFDPLFKMKRDILVTMYSVLVLTVFAALSFPEILYHV